MNANERLDWDRAFGTFVRDRATLMTWPTRPVVPSTTAGPGVEDAQFLRLAPPGWLLRLEPLAEQRELLGKHRGIAGFRPDLQALRPGIH